MTIPDRPRSTIRDVAALAGVSHQTVSRVINGSERVNAETRQRVQTAIAQLEYRPNAIAREMAQGRTRILACLSPNLTDYTLASIIEGAENEARQHGYFLMSASAPDEIAFGTLVEQLISSRRAEGLMVINPYADLRYTHLPAHTPMVFVGARPRSADLSAIALDDQAAGYAATRHLITLGHRHIAMITGPCLEDCTQDRQNGYEAALNEANIPLDKAFTFEGDWSATSGYQAVRQFIEHGKPMTAIFAQNDRMAIGAIRALREFGQRVPDDVSIIGFDDMPLASYFDPPLTTMRQDTYKIGQAAAQMLIRAIENPKLVPEFVKKPAELIIRRSTAQDKSNPGGAIGI